MAKYIDRVLKSFICLFCACAVAFMLFGCAPQVPAGYGGYGPGYGYAAPGVAYAQAPPGPMGGGGVLVVPTATGFLCEAPAGTSLEIDNDSSYLIEVVSSQVMPLACDARQSLVPAMVLRRDGTQLTTYVIPPRTRAQYVFLVLDGGASHVRVTYYAYINLGPYSPAAPWKFAAHTYEPMDYRNGVHQDISNGDLHTFSHKESLELLQFALRQSRNPLAAYLSALSALPEERSTIEAALADEITSLRGGRLASK